jgi:hypothetical protein
VDEEEDDEEYDEDDESFGEGEVWSFFPGDVLKSEQEEIDGE